METTHETQTDLGSALNELADACMETTGASFYLSKKKTGMWIVNFGNKGIGFEDVDPTAAIEKATKYLKEHRRPIHETKFTLY